MISPLNTRERCILTCVSDLRSNGIDLTDADDSRVTQVVREHLDYFQHMLGYDSDAAEIIELVKARRRAGN